MSSVLISQLIQLFLIMFLGYFLYKIQIFNEMFVKMLTRFVLECTLPLQILSSVMNPEGGRDYAGVGLMFLYSLLVYVLFTAIAVVFSLVIPYRKKEKGLYMFAHLFSNVGFMGFPIIEALYGSGALLYTAIINIMFNLFAYTVGVVMINYKKEAIGKTEPVDKMSPGDKPDSGYKMDPVDKMKPIETAEGTCGHQKASGTGLIQLKDMLTPGFLGIVLAILVYFIPVTWPEFLVGAVSRVGNLTSPLAMLIIGASLAKLPIKNVFTDWYIYLFLVIRQILIPVMVWPLFCILMRDEQIRSLMFILLAMPVANMIVMFANQYEADDETAAKIVFITTIASVFTIPLVLMIVGI